MWFIAVSLLIAEISHSCEFTNHRSMPGRMVDPFYFLSKRFAGCVLVSGSWFVIPTMTSYLYLLTPLITGLLPRNSYSWDYLNTFILTTTLDPELSVNTCLTSITLLFLFYHPSYLTAYLSQISLFPVKTGSSFVIIINKVLVLNLYAYLVDLLLLNHHLDLYS